MTSAKSHTSRERAGKPVLARHAPIGRARTRNGAVRLALRFLGPVDRMLIDAGFRLQAREDRGHFHVTLAK